MASMGVLPWKFYIKLLLLSLPLLSHVATDYNLLRLYLHYSWKHTDNYILLISNLRSHKEEKRHWQTSSRSYLFWLWFDIHFSWWSVLTATHSHLQRKFSVSGQVCCTHMPTNFLRQAALCTAFTTILHLPTVDSKWRVSYWSPKD